MINVGIELSPSIDQKTGIGTYSYLLCQHLLEHKDKNIFYKHIYNFILNKNRQKFFFNTSYNKNYVIRLPKRYYYNLYKLNIPVNFFTGNLDVLHITGLMNIHTSKKVKKISTIHDIAYLRTKELYPQKFIDYLNDVITKIINSSDLLLSSSYSTAKDLMELYNVPSDKIKTVYFNASELYRTTLNYNDINSFKQKNKLPYNYFLFVGTLERRKNLFNIIKAFSLFKKNDNKDYYLIIIGKGDKEYLQKYCIENEIDRYVIFKGYIDLEDLPYYYKLSKYLLYISYYEGFGIPILEAYNLDVPVITTNNSSMKELAGEAGIYVNNPQNIFEIADVLKYAVNISDDDLTKIKDKFPKILSKFNFTENSKKIINIYKKI